MKRLPARSKRKPSHAVLPTIFKLFVYAAISLATVEISRGLSSGVLVVDVSNLLFQNPVVAVRTATTTVAYVVSITSCGGKIPKNLYDVAAVLQTSIRQNSHPAHASSRYASKTYAMLPPTEADSNCAKALQAANFTLLALDFPVQVNEIAQVEGAMLREVIHRDGCCGEKELIKLHVYNLTSYKVAIHLDLDTLIVQPLDPLIDVLVHAPDRPIGERARKRLLLGQESNATTMTNDDKDTTVPLAAPTYQATVPRNELVVDAFYTKDYNMLPRGKESRVGIQGGFLMVRPNPMILNELLSMVRSGRFYPGRDEVSGWFQSGYGLHIWGAMTIQGLLAYYYDQHKATNVEVHRCRFNQIADNPRRSSFHKPGKYPRGTPMDPNVTSYYDMDCRDGRENCDDVQCQTWPIRDSYVLHYTYCKAPWTCPDGAYMETYKDKQCKFLYREWFSVRKQLEGGDHDKNSPRAEPRQGSYFPEWYQGFCEAHGQYIPLLQQPQQ